MAEPAVQSIEAFIARWQGSGAAERANYQLFLSELCDALGVARPEPKTPYEDQLEIGDWRFLGGSRNDGMRVVASIFASFLGHSLSICDTIPD